MEKKTEIVRILHSKNNLIPLAKVHVWITSGCRKTLLRASISSILQGEEGHEDPPSKVSSVGFAHKLRMSKLPPKFPESATATALPFDKYLDPSLGWLYTKIFQSLQNI